MTDLALTQLSFSFGTDVRDVQEQIPTKGECNSSDQEIRDRRAVERRHVLKKGTVHFLESDVILDCLILGISEKGARIRPCDVQSCPEQFRLMWSDKGPRLCEVAWRDEIHLGVRFL